MHSLAVQLAPVLAAEKSKLPFYIAGGLLVAWALLVSVGIGMRRSDFPSNQPEQRLVMAITAVLVIAAISMAVVTSGGSSTSQAESGTSTQATSAAEAPAPAATTGSSATTTSSSTPTTNTTGSSSKPKATTGTPNPPSSPAAPRTSVLKLAANTEGQLSYDTKQLSAKAGRVTIAFTNAAPIEHNVTIAQGSKDLAATPSFISGTKQVAVALKPGKYTFFCSVPGHRQAGMEGTLSVS